MKHCFLVCLALLVIAAALTNSVEAAETARPNIVFILVDDLGYNGVGYSGSKLFETPQIDRLAAEGMRFTNAYAPAPICSASRAAFLTGKTPARLRFEFVTKHEAGRQNLRAAALRTPPYTLDLPLAETTIAEVLRDAGYATAFFGKWHVNAHHERYLGWSPTHGPQQQGFDTASEDFGGHPYNEATREIPPDHYRSGEYPPDSMTDKAIAFIEQQADRDEPFYLQVNHFYVHVPVRSQADWLTQKYVNKLGEDEPTNYSRYAAFVEILDHHIGRLVAALDGAGLREKTLVVFTSDNGGDPNYTRHAPLRGHKWTLYEGGIRVPLVARWPGVIDAGRASAAPVSGVDLLPTFAEAAGANIDDSAIDGRSIGALLASKSESPQEEQIVNEFNQRPLVWHFPYYHPERNVAKLRHTAGIDDPDTPFLGPHSAIRRGNDKAVYWYEDDRLELFDLAADPGEQRDLSEARPELAKQMRMALRQYLDEVDARYPQQLDGSVRKP